MEELGWLGDNLYAWSDVGDGVVIWVLFAGFGCKRFCKDDERAREEDERKLQEKEAENR